MVYNVTSADTLYLIAKKFGTTVPAIMKANNLHSTIIYPGQKLVIPFLFFPAGVFGMGSTGEDVRNIQQLLINMGFSLAANGIYDFNTANSIRNIQKKYPEILTADGIYGPKTKTTLQSLYNRLYRIVQDPSSLLVLVNKNRALPASFVPYSLVKPDVPAAADFSLRPEAASALEALFAKANHDGISLYGVSGYRSYDRQATLFAANIAKNPNANFTSARPGESEHSDRPFCRRIGPFSSQSTRPVIGETKRRPMAANKRA